MMKLLLGKSVRELNLKLNLKLVVKQYVQRS